MQEHTVKMPDGLSQQTAELVARFAEALADKLHKAEEKYSYSAGWMQEDWRHQCEERLVEHVQKGDPLDVAAYCAFMWHHGWRSSLRVPVQRALGHSPHAKDAKVLAMRRAGLTLKAIGDELGLSSTRVSEIECRAKRLEQEKILAAENPRPLLSVRVMNCLQAEYWSTHGYSAGDEPPPALVRKWLESGELRKLPNMGKKSIEMVRAWLASIGA